MAALPAVLTGLALCCFVTDLSLEPHTRNLLGLNSAFRTHPSLLPPHTQVSFCPWSVTTPWRTFLVAWCVREAKQKSRPGGVARFLHSPPPCKVFPHLCQRLVEGCHMDVKCPTLDHFKTVWSCSEVFVWYSFVCHAEHDECLHNVQQQEMSNEPCSSVMLSGGSFLPVF